MAIFPTTGPRKLNVVFIQLKNSGAEQAIKQAGVPYQVKSEFMWYEVTPQLISFESRNQSLLPKYKEQIDAADCFVLLYNPSSNASANVAEKSLEEIVAYKETSRFAFVIGHSQLRLPTMKKAKVPLVFGEALAMRYDGEFTEVVDIEMKDASLVSSAKTVDMNMIRSASSRMNAKELLKLCVEEICAFRKVEKKVRLRRLDAINAQEQNDDEDGVSNRSIMNLLILALIALLLTLAVFKTSTDRSLSDATLLDELPPPFDEQDFPF